MLKSPKDNILLVRPSSAAIAVEIHAACGIISPPDKKIEYCLGQSETVT